MTSKPFREIARVDAYEKVRGAALYGADNSRPGMLHAVLALATIARGRIATLDTSAAAAAPGVRLVLTHEDMAGIKPAGYLFAGGFSWQSVHPMLSPEIAYRGQAIALVVADTLENAVRGAELVRATYSAIPHNVNWDEAPAADRLVQAETPLPPPIAEDKVAGDADKAYAEAAIKIDVEYVTPSQHHNAIELLGTVAEWRDGRLIVHEGTQNAEGVRSGLAVQLGLDRERIQVVSPYAGGGFGQKNSTQMQTVFAAIAARRLGQPVKLVMTRKQVFHDASFRPASRHRVRLGADTNGKIVAAIHEAEHQTSRHDLWPSLYAETTARLHGIENFRGHERLVRLDTQNPGYMRNPWESVAAFVFESAVDELAVKMGVDPVELRLNNDATIDPLSKKPLSSRHVAECLRRGAQRFGWSGRNPVPGSMVAEDGAQIGWGVAIGAYPAGIAPAIARLTVTDTGEANVSVAGHEMGQGIRSAIANILSHRLGVPPQAISVEVGVTGVTPQHLTAGSWGTATAGPAVAQAADELLVALRRLAPSVAEGAPWVEYLRAAGRRSIEVEARTKGHGQPDEIFTRLESGGVAVEGPDYPDFATFSYIAHFVEVRVEPTTRRIRVPRVVSVADCGRVISPRTARSQVMGGVVWGIGQALREEGELEHRFGGFLNANIAEYLIPVNADVGSIEVEFIDEPDMRFSSLGLKNLGEVVMTGVAPAIVNAVFHATGRRLRDLPLRIEHLL